MLILKECSVIGKTGKSYSLNHGPAANHVLIHQNRLRCTRRRENQFGARSFLPAQQDGYNWWIWGQIIRVT